MHTRVKFSTVPEVFYNSPVLNSDFLIPLHSIIDYFKLIYEQQAFPHKTSQMPIRPAPWLILSDRVRFLN